MSLEAARLSAPRNCRQEELFRKDFSFAARTRAQSAGGGGLDAAERMLRDGVPGEFLEQAVQLFGFRQFGDGSGHGLAHGAATVNHGEVAVRGEHPDVLTRMAAKP